MSRSVYSDDYDDYWYLIRWRGAVKSAIRGKRGQAFLKEMLVALDSLPNKRIIDGDLEAGGDVCAIGAVGKLRRISMEGIHVEDRAAVADAFGIAGALAAEIMYENDEGVGYWVEETPERRYDRMRNWVASQIVNSD